MSLRFVFTLYFVYKTATLGATSIQKHLLFRVKKNLGVPRHGWCWRSRGRGLSVGGQPKVEPRWFRGRRSGIWKGPGGLVDITGGELMRGGGHEKNHMLFGGWSLLFFLGGGSIWIVENSCSIWPWGGEWCGEVLSLRLGVLHSCLPQKVQRPNLFLGYWGILFLDHPKDHSLFSSGLAGVSIFSNERSCHTWNHKTHTCRAATPENNLKRSERPLLL